MKRRDFLRLAALAAIVTTAAPSCGSLYRDNYASPKTWGSPRKFPSSQVMRNKKKVLLIGIDGLRPDALEAANTPNLDSLIENGIYCNNVHAGPHTISGSGWSNIFTGVWPDKHNVIDNVFSTPRYDKYPTLFTRLEQTCKDFYTVSLTTWKPLNEIINTRMDYGAYYPLGFGDHLIARDASNLLLHSDPDVMFTYFGDVDVVGHEEGFHPEVWQYMHQIEKTDRYVGHVLNSLRSRPTYKDEDWLVICTTDHGGTRYGHYGKDPANSRVFYIVNGKSVNQCASPQRPGLVDVAPTIYRHLDVLDPNWDLDGQAIGFRSSKCSR